MGMTASCALSCAVVFALGCDLGFPSEEWTSNRKPCTCHAKLVRCCEVRGELKTKVFCQSSTYDAAGCPSLGYRTTATVSF
ncbi:hypothetical protein V8C86DRAFT_2562213, partial [Haematococcus lacustris]